MWAPEVLEWTAIELVDCLLILEIIENIQDCSLAGGGAGLLRCVHKRRSAGNSVSWEDDMTEDSDMTQQDVRE